MGLCLAPFPPIYAVGLVLNVINLRLIRLGKLGREEGAAIYLGTAAVLVYSVIWGILLWYFLHYQEWHPLVEFARRLVSMITGQVVEFRSLPRSTIHQI